LEATRRFRKAIRLDHLGENHQRVEVRHRYSAALSRIVISIKVDKDPLLPLSKLAAENCLVSAF
jgi:hypothetical protein